MHYAHTRQRKGSGALISKGPIRSNTYATTKYLQKKRLVCVSFLVVQGLCTSNFVFQIMYIQFAEYELITEYLLLVLNNSQGGYIMLR